VKRQNALLFLELIVACLPPFGWPTGCGVSAGAIPLAISEKINFKRGFSITGRPNELPDWAPPASQQERGNDATDAVAGSASRRPDPVCCPLLLY
jgi:hypothetical protein